MSQETVEIRISDILKTILKKRKLILWLAVAGLAVGILLSVVSYLRGEMSKEYAITSSFAVTSTTQDGLFTSQTNNPNSTDIYLAENMVDSVIYVIKSDRTLDVAIGKLDLVGISTKDINKNLTAKQYNETQIVELTLYWRSAEEGVKILEAINSVSPAILIDTLKIGGVSVVNKPTARYIIGGSVNAALWIYMTILGAALGIGISLLEMFLRPTVINAEDVNGYFGLDLLTEIPDSQRWFDHRCYITDDTESTEERQTRIQFSFLAHIIDVRLSAENKKFLFISSVCPDEGRSSVTAGVGDGLNALEKKVLLVDLDVEQPELGALFGYRTDYNHSLNALYRGDAIEEDVIMHVRPGFDVLPAILDEQKLPTDGSMITLLKRIALSYDYVLIDSPATRQAGKIMDMNQLGGTILWLIRYDTAPVNEIRKTLEHMKKSGMSILGCVVNAVPGEMIRFKPSGDGTVIRSAAHKKRYGTGREVPEIPVTEEKESLSGQDVLKGYILPDDTADDAPLAGQNSAGTGERTEPTGPMDKGLNIVMPVYRDDVKTVKPAGQTEVGPFEKITPIPGRDESKRKKDKDKSGNGEGKKKNKKKK